MENTSWIQFEHITKKFPGVLALDDVSFDIKKGEIVALCGENGAGKSTLINICSGLFRQDGGRVLVNGSEMHFKSAKDAEEARIATVHQEVPACLNMTVAENMFLGPKPVRKGLFLDKKYMKEQTGKLLSIFGMNSHYNTRMANLTIAEQSLIQILKAIDTKPEFLILDEPTSSLAEDQKEILFGILRKMREEDGVTILYVSHRMEEVMEISDRVVVLRDGKFVGDAITKDITVNTVIKMMVGREMHTEAIYQKRELGDVVLKVSNLNRGRVLKDINFEVKKGEILGFAGFQGAGRSEVSRAVFGLDSSDSMNVEIKGKNVKIKHSSDAIKHGIALISENRRDDGVISNMNVQQNMVVVSLKDVARKMMVNTKICEQRTKSYVDDMSIKLSSQRQLMVNLSGGNQQKVIIGRWLMSNPEILFCDEPTRGIDVGAKAEIHSTLMKLAQQGMSIIVISSELPEIMTVCDRVVVMCEGRITGELQRSEFSEEAIVALASDIAI